MNKVNSFTFYYDYYNLIDTLPIEDKSILLIAITDYVFKDIEPILKGHNQAVFNTLKSQLNLSKNNSKRSKKNEPEENQKANQRKTGKQTGKQTGKKPNEKPEENKTSVLSFKFLVSNLEFLKDRGLLRGKIEDWLMYKKERKEHYTETGLKSLLTQIENNTKKYGEEKIVNLIDECMANNYKGIIFDRLKNEKPIKTEQVPDWFNKNVDDDLLTDEELEAFEKELRGEK